MTDLLALAVDPELSKEGKWSTWLGIRLKIRPATSPDFAARVQELLVLEHVKRREAGEAVEELDAETRLRLTQEAAGELLLVDWGDLEFQGESVPYSKEKSVEFLTDPRFASLWQYVDRESSSASGFRADPEAFQKAMGDLLGKPSASSDTPPPMATSSTSSES